MLNLTSARSAAVCLILPPSAPMSLWVSKWGFKFHMRLSYCWPIRYCVGFLAQNWVRPRICHTKNGRGHATVYFVCYNTPLYPLRQHHRLEDDYEQPKYSAPVAQHTS
ncbi:hypothetical protein J3458_009529 [Metarhizium acridum]|uniref:uncharacterized protein n=1 Tax=Metarhizium acridum TaxID=92637 RepID=UPI001C6AF4B7|nr:hypothetical protein J3458_009529 [Metarhizium acridum]